MAFRQSHAEDVEAGMSVGPSTPPSDADWAANQGEMERLWAVVREELGGACQVGIARYVDNERVVEWHPRERGSPPGLR
jgi:hypothetical protein